MASEKLGMPGRINIAKERTDAVPCGSGHRSLSPGGAADHGRNALSFPDGRPSPAEGTRLVAAFLGIADGQARRSLIELAERLSNGTDDRSRADPA